MFSFCLIQCTGEKNNFSPFFLTSGIKEENWPGESEKIYMPTCPLFVM